MKKHVQRFFSILAIILFFVITYYMGRPLVAFVSEPGAFQAWVDAQGFVGVLLFLGMLVLQVFAHHCFCMFKQSVGKRTLAVVNVRYNAKIPYMIHLSSITVRRYAFLVKY